MSPCRGKIGAACATTDDGHLAAFHGFDSFPFTVKFANRLHADSREHVALYANSAKGRTQGQRVNYSGTHAHLVAFYAVKTLASTAEAAENVAATNDNAYLHPHFECLLYLCCIFVKSFDIDAITLFAHETLAAELEQNAFEFSHNVDTLFCKYILV